MSFVYKGVEADFKRYIVTEQDVKENIEHILEENHKCEHVTDRPTQLGDSVVLDYAGFCDGEQFQGGTAEHQHLTLGSGQFIPGFEEQLVGKNIGEEVCVHVTFPEAYHAENLAGKPAEFRCKIHEIHVHSKYELNDEFAKEVGGCETLEEFREKLALSMQAYVDDRAELDLQDRLIRKVAETLDYNPTEEEIEKESNIHIRNLSAELAQQGINLEMYCSFTGKTIEQIMADAKNASVVSLRIQAAIDKIAEIENIKADEKDVDDALMHIARQNNMTLEEIKHYCNEEMEKELINSVVIAKVMRFVRDAANITEE